MMALATQIRQRYLPFIMTHKFQNITIHISDEQTFSFDWADNRYKYMKHFFGESGQEFPVSNHSIKIFKDDGEINSCIINWFGWRDRSS